jgi:hypothetical protein
VSLFIVKGNEGVASDSHRCQVAGYHWELGQKWGKPNAKSCHPMPFTHLRKLLRISFKANIHGRFSPKMPRTPAQSGCVHQSIFFPVAG